MTVAVGTRPGTQNRVSRVKPGAKDILGRFTPQNWAPGAYNEEIAKRAFNELSVKAANERKTLTQLLEEMDPSSDYGPSDGVLAEMDAFERQLWLSGIRTQSDPVKGIFADTVERFYMSDQPASPVLFPEFINRQLRVALIAPPILDELVAITTPSDSDAYRTIYLQDTVGQRRMSRVTQASELPKAKITMGEKTINLYKYGMVLEGSYEAFRRMKIDLFAVHLGRIALQSQLDKSATALDTLINGDGNSNSATNWNLSALDSSATLGQPTYKSWLRWGLKLWPYMLNTVVGGEAELLSVLTLQFPNINPLTILSMLQSGQPVDMKVEIAQNLWTTIRLVYLATAPSNVLVGINKQTALEMVTEVGASLTETDRIITRQMNNIVISEVVGFSILMPQAIQTFTINA